MPQRIRRVVGSMPVTWPSVATMAGMVLMISAQLVALLIASASVNAI